MQRIDYGTYNPFASSSSSSSSSLCPAVSTSTSTSTAPVHAPTLHPVRGRAQPFPAPRGREYPVLRAPAPIPAPVPAPIPPQPRAPDVCSRRRRRTTGGAVDMYFDETLGEWRRIPSGHPERNPSRFQEAEAEAEEEEAVGQKTKKKRDVLKKLGRELVLAVKNLGVSQEKKDRDDEDRRARLIASISAPMGTTKCGQQQQRRRR